MPKANPTPDYDRRLFAAGETLRPLREVNRPRALRFAYLTAILGSTGIFLVPFGALLEWACFGLAAVATARVAHLLLDKSTWIERRSSSPAPVIRGMPQ